MIERSALLAAALIGGCAVPTAYVPRTVARGEITLRYRGAHFEAWAGGARVARGLRWRGLSNYVGCVREAKSHADEARDAGARALGFSVAGGVLGGLALGGLLGTIDETNRWDWFSAGVAAGGLGLIFVGVGRLSRNGANGHAVDAINYYNDAVGSLGATCSDLRYPPPTGPSPPAQ
jgi:hypothetical protein